MVAPPTTRPKPGKQAQEEMPVRRKFSWNEWRGQQRAETTPNIKVPSPPGYRTWREWEALGVKIEWFPKEKAPKGLLREEREICVNFWASDMHAEIQASRQDWMRRLEGLGIAPIRIEAYERGDGEMRRYLVPVSWVKRPYPPSSQNKGGKYLRWEQWQEKGVYVQHTANSFPRDEQETSFSTIDTEPKMEINTCNKAWQRRLEAEGAKPWTIDASRDGHSECRSYVVPKSWVKLPGKRGRR